MVKKFGKIQHKLGVEDIGPERFKGGLGVMPVNRFWGQLLGALDMRD